jgi:hypothetical protein
LRLLAESCGHCGGPSLKTNGPPFEWRRISSTPARPKWMQSKAGYTEAADKKHLADSGMAKLRAKT